MGGLVWGISWVGDAARRGLGPRDRYTARFADIECAAPPGLDRATFLAEVRYSSNFPETFQSLDPELRAKLSAAFTAHPWVASLNDLLVEAGGTVRVALRFRVPVLAVKTTDGAVRVADAAGSLLPLATSTEGLPELVTPLTPPTQPAGQVWADAAVKRALELVDGHHPRQLEKTPQGWRLYMADGKTLTVEK